MTVIPTMNPEGLARSIKNTIARNNVEIDELKMKEINLKIDVISLLSRGKQLENELKEVELEIERRKE